MSISTHSILDSTVNKPPHRKRRTLLSSRMFAVLLVLIGSASAVHVGMLFYQQRRRDLARLELERFGASVPYGVTHLTRRIDRWLPDDFARLFYLEEWEVHFPPEYAPLDHGKVNAELATLDGLTCVRVVRLGGTLVTDAGIAHLRRSTTLRELHLDGTQITDDGLRFLSALSQLELLSLYFVPVSDAGIEHLKDLSHLKKLYLYGTQVTKSGVVRLKEALPGAEIHTDWKTYE
jgi:hypothetical protein